MSRENFGGRDQRSPENTSSRIPSHSSWCMVKMIPVMVQQIPASVARVMGRAFFLGGGEAGLARTGFGRRRIRSANRIERTARMKPFWVVKNISACREIHSSNMLPVSSSSVSLICEYPCCFLMGVISLSFLLGNYKEKR